MKPRTEDLDVLLEQLAERSIASNTRASTAEEAQQILEATKTFDDVKRFDRIALKMHSKNYPYTPIQLGVVILRRYVEVSPDKKKAKAFLYEWLWLHGLEYDNDQEGVKLLEEIGNRIEIPWYDEQRDG